MNNFALIGAAGYVAPRHMKAIKETGSSLLAAMDKFDSVGVIDSYFPNAAFFTEFERFDRHIEKLRRNGKHVDFLSVCSPNYLHDAHIRFGLRMGSNVICEKPLVLNPWNVEALSELENEYGAKVYTILQLRLHEQAIRLKEQVDNMKEDKHEVELTYITSRGSWYYTSWKGNKEKSGGIATNIGVHFFDLLTWLYGDVEKSIVHNHAHDRASGILYLQKAKVKWFLSINAETIPPEISASGKRVYRVLKLGDQSFDFSTGFENLHTKSYQHILDGQGFEISESRKAIELVHQIRNAPLSPLDDEAHQLAHLSPSIHPFNSK